MKRSFFKKKFVLYLPKILLHVEAYEACPTAVEKSIV